MDGYFANSPCTAEANTTNIFTHITDNKVPQVLSYLCCITKEFKVTENLQKKKLTRQSAPHSYTSFQNVMKLRLRYCTKILKT
jgi:hypothetical protein